MEKEFCRIFPNENFVDLSLYQFGYEECDPLHLFGPATRNHFLFHYILSGRGRFEARDDQDRLNVYHLEAGQGFLIWPRAHTFYIADEWKPWVYAWVEFDGLKARELMIQAGLAFNYPVYTSKNSEEREKMKSSLLTIVSNKNSPPLSTIGHLYLFMSALIASSSLEKKIGGGGGYGIFISGNPCRLSSSVIRMRSALKTSRLFVTLTAAIWVRSLRAYSTRAPRIFLSVLE